MTAIDKVSNETAYGIIQNPPKEVRERAERLLFELIVDHPFIGYLCSMLVRRYVRLPNFYAATNGEELFLDIEKITALPDRKFKGLLAHEVIHCILRHTDPSNWKGLIWRILSIAFEYIVNHMVLDVFRLELPDGAIYSSAYSDGSWSEIKVYQEILKKASVTESDGGDADFSRSALTGSGGDEEMARRIGANGKLIDDHAELERAQAKRQREGNQSKEGNDWESLVAQAATIARMRGKFPDNLARLVDVILKKKLDLHSLLANFMTRARNEYDWSKPNKRTWWRGVYTPGRRSRKLLMAIAVDTSGSMGLEEVGEGLGIIQEVADSFGDYELHLFGIDADIHHYQIVTPGDEIDFDKLAIGGGGTDFRPVFEKIAKEDIQIEGMMYFTDTQGTYPREDPPYPVLWICKGKHFERIPFGDKVYIDQIGGSVE